MGEVTNVKICNVFHNSRFCLNSFYKFQRYLFHSNWFHLHLLGVHFLLLLCFVHVCFEILYKSKHCRCFVFVELFIHVFLLHFRWDQMVLHGIDICCFAYCFICFGVIFTWINIWRILSYVFCYFCWNFFII